MSDFKVSGLQGILLEAVVEVVVVVSGVVASEEEEDEIFPGGHLRGGSDSVLEVDSDRLEAEPGLLKPRTPAPIPIVPMPQTPVSWSL